MVEALKSIDLFEIFEADQNLEAEMKQQIFSYKDKFIMKKKVRILWCSSSV